MLKLSCFYLLKLSEFGEVLRMESKFNASKNFNKIITSKKRKIKSKQSEVDIKCCVSDLLDFITGIIY